MIFTVAEEKKAKRIEQNIPGQMKEIKLYIGKN